jgi:hypothetical protein
VYDNFLEKRLVEAETVELFSQEAVQVVVKDFISNWNVRAYFQRYATDHSINRG